jgi:hypothetical protein
MSDPVTDAPLRARRAARLTALLRQLIAHPASVGYLIADVAGTASITCVHCGLTSVNLGDIEEKFCWRCQVFHEARRDR